MNSEIERLAKEALSYDASTGLVSWLKHVGTSVPGAEAGCKKSGGLYRHIRIGGKLVMTHQIAWFLHFGKWAGCSIDHINGDGLDNRIENLRKCTPTQNQWNSNPRKGRVHPKGVSSHFGKWQARIIVNKKLVSLGVFETPEAASEAYIQAARSHAGEFAYANRHAAIRAKFARGDLKDAAK